MIEEEIKQPKKSWVAVAGIIGFVIVTVFSIFAEIKQSNLEDKIARLQAQKEQLASMQDTELRTATRARALSIRDQLAAIEAKQLAWSKIVEKIENTIPKVNELNDPLVVFRSYNGNDEGRISINATTRADTPDPFGDVAATIRAFNATPVFEKIFIPSVSKSLTPEGGTVLSFSMGFEYNREKLIQRANGVEKAPEAREPVIDNSEAPNPLP